MKVNDAPGHKVIIRGPALFSVEKYLKKGVSQNMRRYVQDEILRSARTLKGNPIDVNHEISVWEEYGQIGPKPSYKGHVIYGEEENGVLEYVAEINHKEYVDKVRDTDKVRKGKMTEEEYFQKWHKKPLLGVSVDADFIKLKCTRCGRDFYDPKEYERHMIEEEHIRNFQLEAHGIVFKRLSLVEPPQVPGVLGADFEIVETSQDGFSRLLETVIKRGELTEMQKASRTVAVETSTSIAVGPTAKPSLKAKEQQAEHQCGEGEHWSEEQGKCVPKKVEAQEEGIKPGSHYCEEHPDDPRCKEHKKAIHGEEPKATEQEEHTCPEGEHWSEEQGNCVADEAPTQETFKIEIPTLEEPKPQKPIQTAEITLPKPLKLGEPFGGYTDFADCVAKNQDQDDPGAYCVYIKHKTEGETVKPLTTSENIYETQKQLASEMSKSTSDSYIRDIKLAEYLNSVGKALQQIFPHFKTTFEKMREDADANSKAQITQINEALSKIGNQMNEFATTYNKKLVEVKAKLPKDDLTWKTEIKQEIGRVSDNLAHYKEDYDKTFKDIDTKVVEFQSTTESENKELKEKVQKLEDEKAKITEELGKFKQEKEKTVQETQKTKIRMDNVEDKLQKLSKYKGQSQPINEQEAEPGSKNLQKLMKVK